jgi:hypothetical protein
MLPVSSGPQAKTPGITKKPALWAASSTGLFGTGKDIRAALFSALIDFFVGTDLKQENIVFWLIGAFHKIKNNAEVITDTTSP